MKFDKKSLLLYAVTDRAWTQNESLYSQVEKALKGGVTFLQIREKNLPKQEFKTEAEELKTLAEKYSVPFVVNDDVLLAKEIDAHDCEDSFNECVEEYFNGQMPSMTELNDFMRFNVDEILKWLGISDDKIEEGE